MKIATTLEEILKGAKESAAKKNSADSYEEYLMKNGINNRAGYADAVNALYLNTKKGLSSYGINNRNINSKGLQNSGYAAYIDDLASSNFTRGLADIKESYVNKEGESLLGYAGYLDKYADTENRLKRSVMSHLIKNGITDLNTAIAYGISAGLSEDAANEIGRSAYEVTKQKAFNSVLEQTVRLGLDAEGAKMLAMKMGINETDALTFAKEIEELLDYYGNISEEYLEYLEQRTK